MKIGKRIPALAMAMVLATGFTGVDLTIGKRTEVKAEEGSRVSYPVEGGNIYFNPETGEIVDADFEITGVIIPSEINGVKVTGIGQKAFSYNDKLKSVVLPNSMTYIDICAFDNCSSLESITIPSSVTTIGNSAFYKCESLMNIIIPEGVVSIGDAAFMECSSLTNITIPESVTYIGMAAFTFCYSLTDITILSNITIINERMFANCTSLKSITIPNGVTDIYESAFSGCTSLKNVNLPNTITCIDVGAFEECSSLEGITIPNGVTDICDSAFSGCSSLKSVNLPDTITNIDVCTFGEDDNLTDVYYAGSESEWNKIDIVDDGNEPLTKATIHYNSSIPQVTASESTTVSSTTPSYSYIYDVKEEGSDFKVDKNELEKINSSNNAKTVVEKALANVSDSVKQSATGIDKITLFAEEAIANSSISTKKDSSIAIDNSSIKEALEKSNKTYTDLQQYLEKNDIKPTRKMRKGISIKINSEKAVHISQKEISSDVDFINLKTDYGTITLDPKSAVDFTVEKDSKSNSIKVAFDDKSNKSKVKVSFANMSDGNNYKAVVDENGKAIGGKYNPITEELSAKVNVSGVYTAIDNEKSFNDIKDKSTEMQEAIKALAAKGIISGTSKTEFSPDKSISRAEVAAIILRSISKLDENATSDFGDVAKSDWYYGTAGSSKNEGIIKGYEDNTFRGGVVIPKDQIISVSARVLKNEMNYNDVESIVKELAIYKDNAEIAQWAKNDIALATATNMVIKRTDSLFGGKEEMTRGDAAIILKRLFDKLW